MKYWNSRTGEVPCLAHLEALNGDQSFRNINENDTQEVATLPTLYNDSKNIKSLVKAYF